MNWYKIGIVYNLITVVVFSMSLVLDIQAKNWLFVAISAVLIMWGAYDLWRAANLLKIK